MNETRGPCEYCGVHYRECAATWVVSRKCCPDCAHDMTLRPEYDQRFLTNRFLAAPVLPDYQKEDKMSPEVAEVMAWIADDPEGVARSLVAAQAEIDRLRKEAQATNGIGA